MFNKIKAIPTYGWVCGVVFFALQFGLYRLGNFLSHVIGSNANAWCPKIELIDDLFSVVPVFIIIYVFSYAFWIFGTMAVSLTQKSNFINYLIGLSAAYLIGFLIFVFTPSYMDRVAENLTAIGQGNGVFSGLLAFVYDSDGSRMAFNLFPSYHCLISLYCYLGVRKQPEISKGFKIYSAVMVVLICLSTLFTKQHYVLDMIGGLGIALCCYLVVEKINPGAKLEHTIFNS